MNNCIKYYTPVWQLFLQIADGAEEVSILVQGFHYEHKAEHARPIWEETIVWYAAKLGGQVTVWGS